MQLEGERHNTYTTRGSITYTEFPKAALKPECIEQRTCIRLLELGRRRLLPLFHLLSLRIARLSILQLLFIAINSVGYSVGLFLLFDCALVASESMPLELFHRQVCDDERTAAAKQFPWVDVVAMQYW
jgi:hypothetical protein